MVGLGLNDPLLGEHAVRILADVSAPTLFEVLVDSGEELVDLGVLLDDLVEIVDHLEDRVEGVVVHALQDLPGQRHDLFLILLGDPVHHPLGQLLELGFEFDGYFVASGHEGVELEDQGLVVFDHFFG